jgi:2-furoyl-CoA dehydrogenase large subunit
VSTTTTETTVVQETTELQKGHIGTSIPRKEDRRLVQGQGLFFDDVRRHGTGFVHFVRSPYAHAKILSIDVAPALALDGVYGTITGDEVAIQTDPFFEMSTPPGNRIKDYALAVGKVRHMGEPVAAVVARTRELARDAADLVEVEYEPLPVVLDAEESVKDETVLHEDAGSNVVWSGVFDWGDWEAAKAEADHVVTIKRLHFHRFSSTPLECAGALVEYDKGIEQWTLHCPCGSASTSCASSRTTSAAASATRSACTRNTRCSAFWRGSWGGRCSGRSGAPTSTRPTRTATSAPSWTSRWP